MLTHQHVESVNRSVSENLVPVNLVIRLIWDAKVLASLGDVDFITFHGSMTGVVAVVRDSPGEIRSPQKRVRNLKDGALSVSIIVTVNDFLNTKPRISLTILWSEKAP